MKIDFVHFVIEQLYPQLIEKVGDIKSAKSHQ
jgi:hypothetical protein